MKIKGSPIKFVAFDWNGTLLADTVFAWSSMNQMFKSYGLPGISLQRFRETYIMPLQNFYFANGFMDWEKAHESLRIFYEHYDKEVLAARTRRGAREVLGWLNEKNIKRGIFSNQTGQALRSQLDRLKLGGHFDAVLVGHEIVGSKWTHKKDNLKGFLKKSNYRSGNVLVVGDTVEEITIGKKLGLKTVGITGGYNSRALLAKEKPDEIIDTLADLKNF